MSRPKIKLTNEPIDNWVLGLTILGVFLLIGLPLYYYDSLLEKIPVHFGVDGTVDRYGNKYEIFALPLIGSLLLALLRGISKFPHTFNYPVRITEENAAFQYRKGVRLMHGLGLIIVFAFVFLIQGMIKSGLGGTEGLPFLFLPIFLGLIFIFIGYYLVTSLKNNK